MKRIICGALLLVLLVGPDRLTAQAIDVIRIIQAATERHTPAPTPARAQVVRQPSPTPAPAPAKRPPKKSQAAKPKATKSKPVAAESETNVMQQFDGTWLATRTKTSAEGDQINQIFTMVVKDGKAVKTLDTTNTSNPEKPYYELTYELRRKWTYNSTDCTVHGSSLTVQWSPGELSDWSPKEVPEEVVQNFGNPNSETSVYTLKRDELTRINDPNGVTYRRAK
jgi:hypothetical protein